MKNEKGLSKIALLTDAWICKGATFYLEDGTVIHGIMEGLEHFYYDDDEDSENYFDSYVMGEISNVKIIKEPDDKSKVVENEGRRVIDTGCEADRFIEEGHCYDFNETNEPLKVVMDDEKFGTVWDKEANMCKYYNFQTGVITVEKIR